MADLEFWRALSVQFAELHQLEMPVWAEWIEVSGTSDRYTWGLRGSRDCSTRFEELAKIAGGRLLPHAKDKLATWLTTLKVEKPTASRSHSPERKPGGRIDHVCRVAAEYCLELERLSEPALTRLSERIEGFVSTMTPHRKIASRGVSARKRPDVLSVDDRAAIERCKFLVRSEHGTKHWPLLFPPEPSVFDSPVATQLKVPQSLSASLQVELRDYCCALFDCESPAYKRIANDTETLRQWLEAVATSIEYEGIKEMQERFEGLRYSVAERKAVVGSGLKQRVDRVIEQKQAEIAAIAVGPRREEPSPTPVRSRVWSVSEHAEPNRESEVEPRSKSIGDRLDEAAALEDINYDEQARRIGIGRTAYYDARKGKGGKKTRIKIQKYLKRVLSSG